MCYLIDAWQLIFLRRLNLKNDGRRPLCVKVVIESLKEKEEFWGTENTMFRPVWGGTLSEVFSIIDVDYVRAHIQEVRRELKGSLNISAVWIEKCGPIRESFVKLLQLFSFRKATRLKRTEFMLYHVHTNILHVSARRKTGLPILETRQGNIR